MTDGEKDMLQKLFASMGAFKMTPAVLEQMCIESDTISGSDGFLAALYKRIRIEKLTAKLNRRKRRPARAGKAKK